MLTDSQLSATIREAIAGSSLPPLNSAKIHALMAKAEEPVRRPWPFQVALATCTVAVLAVATSAASPAFVRSVQEGYTSTLRLLGYNFVPSDLPVRVRKVTRGFPVTLAQAQARVSYPLVAPRGLPRDVVRSEITANAVAMWSEAKHEWTVGAVRVNFIYFRKDGREFGLVSLPYLRHKQPASVLDVRRDALGKPLLKNGRADVIAHRQFFWNNGAQTIIAVEGYGISTQEIERIRAAMSGN